MPEYNFQLRGWHAVVAVVALLGYFGIQAALRIRPVEEGMRDAVRKRLLDEYSGRGPKDLARMVAESRAGQPVEPLPDVVQRDIQITSMAAHGRMGGATILRVEISVDGAAPPDGRPLRYFIVSRKFMEDGWSVLGESDSYRYYRELAP